ncbi:MAG: DNA-binding protein [Candidatus Woesearchaeota archaeon]
MSTRDEQSHQREFHCWQRLPSKMNENSNNAEEQKQQLEESIKPYLTKEALQRYGTVKLAHPNNAMQALIRVGEILQKTPRMINDQEMKDILTGLSKRKQFRIKR